MTAMQAWLLLLGSAGLCICAAELPAGRIIDDVKCEADPSQSYALYIPSNYSPTRNWSVIFAMDPGARGRRPVAQFQAAAEKYGYVVAGSNNSRNGSWNSSFLAVQAMAADVGSRFVVDPKRIYTAGMSGGARVAMQVALTNNQIAGVIASSAGFPDSEPRKSVPFAIFATAGTEDFNYLELRRLDRALRSPHHLAISEGGHTWLSSDLAVEAIEWMEIQAMKSGRRPKDQALLEELFAKRVSQLTLDTADPAALFAAEAIVSDFEGLNDVSEYATNAAALRRQKPIVDALKKERSEEQREERTMAELATLENDLGDANKRQSSLSQLKSMLSDLSRQSNAPVDSAARRFARRILNGTFVGSMERVKDPDYQKLLDALRPFARPPG
jgi:pimeloyl-ACP methyl ester carboxylesterase